MKNIGASSSRIVQQSVNRAAAGSGARKRTFIRHLIRSISGVSFPLAGSVIVIYTLSGDTRQVAVIATTIAIVGHIVHSMMDLTERDALRSAATDESSEEGYEVQTLIE